MRRVVSSLPLMAMLAALALSGCASDIPNRFGIYTSDLSGRNVRPVLTNPALEMTHARLSHNGQWITFTRYNDKGLSGLARETGGYGDTEIMVVHPDGTGLRTIIQPRDGVIAANSSWTPDDKGLIFISTDNEQKLAQIVAINLETGALIRLPTPHGISVTDPHWVGNVVAFPVKTPGQPDAIWIMNIDGSNLRQLTHPVFPQSGGGAFEQGDYDPRISPDGSKVTFMRLFGKEGWRAVVVDVATGQEKDLTGPGRIDGTPDWTGDGRRVIFWHVNTDNLPETGIYTMNPDGSDRVMVPLPRGYLHGHPSCFPGEATSLATRIIYNAERNPALP